MTDAETIYKTLLDCQLHLGRLGNGRAHLDGDPEVWRITEPALEAIASLCQRQEELEKRFEEDGRDLKQRTQWINDLEAEARALRTQLQQAEQERDKAQAELKFYSDPATYKGLIADNANLESQLQQAETALKKCQEDKS